jgi:3-hydroxybutyryl-CoA dehydrogenase
MKLGLNHPMGPLALADFIGLDTCISILDTLSKGLDKRRFVPAQLLFDKVKGGKLGRKTGTGFYAY